MPKGGIRPRADGSLAHLIQPKWKLGQTKTIRVPVALADQLLEIAHRLDEGTDLSQDIEKIKTEHDRLDREVEMLLKAADKFIELKRSDWGSNPAQKGEFSTASRAWDMFRQFKQLAEQSPEKLLDH